jgi:hypothetical protein
MSYRHGVHHGVHKITVLVSIVVSTPPRSFARVLKRTHNPAHAAYRGQRSTRTMCQRAQEGQNQWRLEAVPGGARI